MMLSPTKRSRAYSASQLVLILLVVVIGIVGYLELHNITYFFHKKPVTASQATKGQPATSPGNSTPSQSQAPNGQNGSQGSTGTNSTAHPITPTGDFVSNHHPNLSGSPAPNQMTSTCTTTPGATCQITFTNGSTTKFLPVETTDEGGSAYWNWKLQDIGLTAGSWKVEAIAQLGSQTALATDAMPMEVQP